MEHIVLNAGRQKTPEQRDLEAKFPTLMAMCKRGLVAVGPKYVRLINPGFPPCMMDAQAAEQFFSKV